MLQIVTKMYYRDGVPLYSSVHRNVLYTNVRFLGSEQKELPIVTLAPSTELAGVSTVTVSATEYLEGEELDGRPAMLQATGGLEIIDDLAVVLSFGLDAVFSRNHDLVRRLVPANLGSERQTQASLLFGRTFQAGRFVSDAELDRLRSFMEQLLVVRRPQYEAAMRAIRRIVGATQRAADDPTVAYVDIVAALESLGAGLEGPVITWDRMEKDRRRLIDAALVGIDNEAADRIRAAILEADRAGATARYTAVVMNNISDSFVRAEAVDVSNPVRGADLERVVKRAYQIRSDNVHVLESLPPEAWMLGAQYETVTPPDGKLMLTHRGLARLAGHVIRNYVAAAPTGVDESFDWRTALPGRLLMPLAPQYWLWRADQLDRRAVDRYFSGFVQHLVEAAAGRNPGVTDMEAVLARIEEVVPKTKAGLARTEMVAIYVLWHRIVEETSHRPDAASFMAKHDACLRPPGLPAFVAQLLLGEIPDWTADEWHSLADERRVARSRTGHLALPPGMDAALQVCAADFLAEADRLDEARRHAAFAVEELPGNRQLLNWESMLGQPDNESINIWELAVRPEPRTTDAADQTASHPPEHPGPGA